MKRSVGVGLASLVLGSSLVVGSPVSAEPVFPNSDTVCDPTQPFTLARTFSPGAEYIGVPPVGGSIVVNSVADLPAALAGLSGTFNGDNGGTPVEVVRSLAAYDNVSDLNWGGQQNPYPGTISAPTFDGSDIGVPAAIAMQDIIDGTPYHKANFTLSDCTLSPAVWPQWSGSLGPFVQENVAPGPLGAPNTTDPRFNSIEMIVRCPAGTTDVDYSWNVTRRGFPSEVRDPGQSGTTAFGSIPTMVADWPGMPLYIDSTTLPAPTLRLVIRPGDAGVINANVTCRQGAVVLAEFDHVSTEANMVWAYQEVANSHSSSFVPVDGSLPLEIGEEFYIDIECDRDAHRIDLSFNPGTTGLTAFSGTYIWTQGVYNRTPYGPIDREPGMTPVWRNGYDSEVDGEIIDLQEPFTWRYGPFVPTSLGTVSYTYACDDHVQGFSGATPVTRTRPVTEKEPDPVYDLALVKVVNDADGVAAPGDSVEWTIRVTNQGNVPSGVFNVTDTLPTDIVFASASNGGTAAAGVVTWTGLPSLAAGASMDLTLTTTVPGDAVDGDVFRNWAEISSDSGTDEDSTPDATTGSGNTPSDPYTDIDALADSTLDNFDATDEDDNDDAQITVDVPTTPGVYDLALAKIVNDADGVVAVGDQVSWTIRVTNQGDVASGTYTITDTLPTGVTFVSASNGGVNAAGRTVTWTMPSIAAGATADVTVITTIDAAGDYRNWAEISSDAGDDIDSTPDTNAGDDQTVPNDPYVGTDDLADPENPGDEDDNDDATITVTPLVGAYDLALVKVVNDADGVAAPGDNVSWTIRVTNQAAVASGVFSVTDTLPTGMTFVSATNSGAAVGSVVTWTDLQSLAPGASVDLGVVSSIPANAADGAVFRNWAEISADSGADEDSTPDATTGTDGTPSDPYTDIDNLDDSVLDNFDAIDSDDNDDAEITVDLAAPMAYDLALVKVVNDADGVVGVGDNVSWTIRVTNQGDVTSGTFNVTDVLPAGLIFVSADNGGTESAGVVTWTGLPAIASGASVDLTVTTAVSAVAAGSTLHNWAEISSDSGDDEDSQPNTDVTDDEYSDIDDLDDSVLDNFDGTDEDDNDDAEVVVTAVAPPSDYDLALAKIVNDADGVVFAGSNVSWTIRVTNQGDVASGAFSVTDTLPSGLTFVSADNGGTAVNGVVTWSNLPSIPAGATFDLHIVTKVGAVGSYRNWAEISTDSGDDVDSTPDTDIANDPYVGTDDLDRPDFGEDDHDDALITVTKNPGPVTGGSTDGMVLFAGFALVAGVVLKRSARRRMA